MPTHEILLVGYKIKEERLKKKLTLRQFAGLANISPSYISQIENSIMPSSTAQVNKLAKALDVDPDIILAGANHCSIRIERDKKFFQAYKSLSEKNKELVRSKLKALQGIP